MLTSKSKRSNVQVLHWLRQNMELVEADEGQ